MSTINERIAQVVESSGLTKTAFAAEINISQPYLSQLCFASGKNPSDRTISDICRIFDVDEIWLRTGEQEPQDKTIQGNRLEDTQEDMKDVETIGKRIKTIRIRSGKSQKKFAESIRLTQNFIWQIEKGQRSPSNRTIMDICNVYGIDENWVRTGAGEMHSKIQGDAAPFGNESEDVFAQLRLIRAIAKLPPDYFPAVEKLLVALADTLEKPPKSSENPPEK